MKLRTSVTLIFVLLAFTAGCGRGSSPGSLEQAFEIETQSLNIEIKRAGDVYRYVAPARVDAGIVEMTIKNSAPEPHSAQLIRLASGHAIQEALPVLKRIQEGNGPPEWLTGAGGAAKVLPGTSERVTLKLTKGDYYFIDTEVRSVGASSTSYMELGLIKPLGVQGTDSSEQLPKAGKIIQANDYNFLLPKLSSGKNVVQFRNVGKEPHHMLAFPLNPGKTLADLKSYFSTATAARGKPPFDPSRIDGSAAVEPGQAFIHELALTQGKYAFACFLANRSGGPIHLARGMVAEATVN